MWHYVPIQGRTKIIVSMQRLPPRKYKNHGTIRVDRR